MSGSETRHAERGDEVALITGGASGIGAGIGRWLARQGVDVVLCDVDGEGLAEVAGEINANGGGRARELRVDVTDESAVEAACGTVEEAYGRLDYLFANAGLAGPVELDGTSYREWQAVIDVNVNGVFLTVKKAVPLLRRGEDPAHVVVTASISGRRPKPVMIPYRTSKAAAIMLTRCLATALGPEVKVNALCPGRIDTELVDELYERRARARDTTVEELKREEEREAPLGRTPEHGDVFEVLEFLLFRDGFVTGHEFHLDGGAHQAL